jgi:pimeloyl-ACP methyl ester carboxylesterase
MNAVLSKEHVKFEQTRGLWAGGSWALTCTQNFIRQRKPDAEVPARIKGWPVVGLLRRFGTERKKRPVLLVHGATAWRGTFMEPHGGLIKYLLPERTVWTLDWRASKVITDPWRDHHKQEVPDCLRACSLDHSSDRDLRLALDIITREGRDDAPAIVGHCIGAAIIATALARQKLTKGAQPYPAPIILSTIGLFYRGSVDSWLRANEHLDETQFPSWRLAFEESDVWPAEYKRFYDVWNQSPYPHCDNLFCRRISSLFGAPYRPNDIDYIHDAPRGLSRQFGVIPLSILNHCAQNLRRGWSGPLEASDCDASDLEAKSFQGMDITLITGSENQLWHRDSMDRMHAWLQRHARNGDSQRIRKRVFTGYGHQDLWWSPKASLADGPYPFVAAHLGR